MRSSSLLVLLALLFGSASFTFAQEPDDEPAVEEQVGDEDEDADEADDKNPLKSSTFSGLKLRALGPAFMSGRIADIVVHPDDQSVWYVAVGSGGVWKTTNAGTTWSPIFDGQSSYSIGCLALDPSNPSTIWVGTGENVGGRHVGYGDGIYRSDDGGASWKKRGLEHSERIGSIIVHPGDSNTVFVAAQGPLWSAGGERGVYKTTDGGETWERLIGDDEYMGANEVVMDPSNPDVLYAAMHQRFRNVAALMNGGPKSGIHKSTDGGATWRELKSGIPGGDKGRIGLAMSPHDTNVVYATIELPDRKGGFWRSANGGASWTKQSDYTAGGTGPHYYQELFACPHVFDRVYHMDVRLAVTHDGGKNFDRVGEKDKHVDNHAMAFDPNDPDYLLVGCDGGLYQSWDLGKNWDYTENLPVTQFYKVAVDNDLPFYNLVGGTQDNSTQSGPSRTDSVNGIRNSDWQIILGGDGHQPATDPTNPNIVYAEWQRGNLMRHDRITGENVYIKPQPRDGEPNERHNWDSPILVSPHDPAVLFFASQRVWRSPDRGDSWEPISDDLTRNLDRLTLPMMGRVWSLESTWDLYAMSEYGTITSLSQSPIDPALIYAGTDDGHIAITEDGGASWRKRDALPGAPDFFFVNDIKADLHDVDTVYLVVDDHKSGDFAPYLMKSNDRGQTWTSMVGDLPERHVLWRIVQDHVDPELFFLGTEFGVFFTVDAGEHWIELTGGVPTISFRDLAIQKRENDLIGATFGRGFFIFDDYSPLRDVDAEALERDALLFKPRAALQYSQRRPLGGGRKASQGATYYTADNPPYGAVFTYYLKEGAKTAKAQRRGDEKKIAKDGGDTPYPGWEALREEDRELDPTIILTITDAEGGFVREIHAPMGKGFHRVAWDLRRASTAPWSDGSGNAGNVDVLPGTYTVSMSKRVGDEFVDLGLEQSFEVVPLRTSGALPGASPADVAAFAERLAELSSISTLLRHDLSEASDELADVRGVLQRTPGDTSAIFSTVRELEAQIADVRLRLSGDNRHGIYNVQAPVPIQSRLGFAFSGTTSYGPTPTHTDAADIAERGLTQLRAEVDVLVDESLPALRERLDTAGAPWTDRR